MNSIKIYLKVLRINGSLELQDWKISRSHEDPSIVDTGMCSVKFGGDDASGKYFSGHLTSMLSGSFRVCSCSYK